VYYKHAQEDDIYLALQIADPETGLGVVGATPQVAIRRVRASQGGGALDGWYWNGTTFTGTPTWHTLTPLDAVNAPGLYSYLFEQSLIAGNIIYLAYFRNTTDPVGFAVEEHVVTDELMIPVGSSVVPVIPGDTVMGRLADMAIPTGEVAQANADAVWDEVLAGHVGAGTTGAALAAASGGRDGSRQITVYLDDQLGDPVSSAQVDLYDAANLVFITRLHTGVDGSVVFALDDGTYRLRIFRSGYTFTTPETLTVTADATVTYEGVRVFTPVAPADPNVCVIYGTIRDVAGNPLPGTCVGAYARTPQDVQGVQLGEQIAHVETDAAGYFELELLRGAEVIVTVESTGLSISRVVPALASQDITTWDV
jgi:hypothetical protein